MAFVHTRKARIHRKSVLSLLTRGRKIREQEDIQKSSKLMDQKSVILITTFIALLGTIFNILTLTVIIADRKLRKRLSYVPIVSFLIGGVIQGLTAAPLYVYKKLSDEEDRESWTCDAYRFPYFFCGHIMKVSLLLVALDRLVAVKYPYLYIRYRNIKIAVFVVVILWISTILVDLIPFFDQANFKDQCQHKPTHTWGHLVIFLYNIIPMVIIITCYSFIWCSAAKVEFENHKIKKSVTVNSLEETNMAKVRKTESNNNSVLTESFEIDTDEIDSIQSQVKKPPPEIKVTGIINVKYQDDSLNLQDELKVSKQDLESSSNCKKVKHSRLSENLAIGLEMKATKTSLTLIVTYVLCWLPLGVVYMVDHFCDYCYSSQDRLTEVRTTVKVLAFSSGILAPIVYCWRNKEFRKSAKKLLYNTKTLAV